MHEIEEDMNVCYCCSGKLFEECCELVLKGLSPAASAEALMRSRYSAYVLFDIPYLLRSTHVSERGYYSAASILDWAQSLTWLKLEVLSVSKGKAEDRIGFVEFNAYYLDKKQTPQIHHEYSSFVKEKGEWYFLKGEEKVSV